MTFIEGRYILNALIPVCGGVQGAPTDCRKLSVGALCIKLTTMKTIAAIVMGVLLLPATSHAAFDVNLRYGSSGAEVIELQEFLTAEGVYTGPITGNFFSLTLAGVKAFQTREGVIPVSGFFGPLTRSAANTLLSEELAASDEEASTTPKVITSNKPRKDSSTTTTVEEDDEDDEVGSFDIDVQVDVTDQRDEDGRTQVYIKTDDDFNYGIIEVRRSNDSLVSRGAFGEGNVKSGFSGGRADVDVSAGTYTYEIQVWKGGRQGGHPNYDWIGGTKVTKTGTFVVE